MTTRPLSEPEEALEREGWRVLVETNARLVAELRRCEEQLERQVLERQRAEDALARSEDRARLAIQAAGVGLWDWDIAAGRMHLSREWKAQLGYADDELPDRFEEWESRLHPEDRAGTLASLTAYLDDPGPSHQAEFRLQHRDGSYRWILSQARAFVDMRGRPARMLGAHVDITESKRLQVRLRQSETLLRTIVESEPECVKLLDEAGRLVQMNPAGLAMIEADSLDEVAGQRVEAIVAPEWREPFRALHRSVFEGRSGTLEFEIVGLRGGRRWLETHAVPLRDSSDGVMRYLAVTRDVTERRRDSAELRRKEARFRALIERSTDVITLFDPDGTILFASPAVRAALGYEPADMVGRRNVDFCHPDDLDEAARVMGALQPSGASETGELRVRHRNGSWRTFEYTARNLIDVPEVGAIVVNSRDVTARRRAERAERESAERLRILSARLLNVQEVERARIARELHDEIGQVLTTVKMQLQALERSGLPAAALPRARSGIEAVDQAIGEVRRLALDLRPSILDDLGLVPALRWFVDQQARHSGLEGTARRGVRDPSPPARPPGDRVLPGGAGSRHQRATARPRAPHRPVALAHRGHGGAVGARRRRRVRRGRGAGTACLRRVPGPGGHGGAGPPAGRHPDPRVVAWRRYTAPRPASGRSASGPGMSAAGTVRVVLADDHALVRSGIRSLLEGVAGIEVVGEAGDGQEALRLSAKLQPHVLLLDIKLPVLNGLEVAARLARDQPAVRVVILSMHATEEYVLHAIRAGAAGYLLKDSTVPELEMAVRAVARGEAYLSPPVSKHLVADYLRRASGEGAVDLLTSRQREILQLVAEGHSTKEIAFRLGLSVKTVESHRAQIMERLDIHDVPGLVRYAIRAGLVDGEA